MRLQALKKIEKDKLQVARAYSKKVRGKSFHVGVLVGRQFYWDKEQQIWQVVAKLERTVQDCQSYLREFIYGGDAARRTSTKSFEWKIFEEILSQHVARCFKNKDGRYRVSPLALFLALYILYKSMYWYLLFSLQSSLKSRGGICWQPKLALPKADRSDRSRPVESEKS